MRSENGDGLGDWSVFAQGWHGIPIAAWGPAADEIPPEAATALQVASGDGFTVALLPGGSIAVWGPRAAEYGVQNSPSGNGFMLVGAGRRHALALRADGSVFAGGDNSFRQTNVPLDVVGVIDFDGGDDFSAAVLSNGQVRVLGALEPRRLLAGPPPGKLRQVVQASAGGGFVVARRRDGTILAWGRNDFGQATVPDVRNALQVLAGTDRGYALRADGSIVSWGRGGAAAKSFVATPAARSANESAALRPAATQGGTTSLFGGLGQSYALLVDGTVQPLDGAAALPRDLNRNVAGGDFGGSAGVLLHRDGPPRGVRTMPQAAKVWSGEAVAFRADTLAQGAVGYTWFKRLAGGNSRRVGFGPVLAFAAPAAADAGEYFVVASNEVGEAPDEERPSVMLTVVVGDADDNGLPDAFEEAWQDARPDLASPSLQADVDADGDGLPEGLAYALGLSSGLVPRTSAAPLHPEAIAEANGATLVFTLPCPRPGDVLYLVEQAATPVGPWATELARLVPGETQWATTNGATVTTAPTSIGEAEVVRLTSPSSTGPVFLRLRVLLRQ